MISEEVREPLRTSLMGYSIPGQWVMIHRHRTADRFPRSTLKRKLFSLTSVFVVTERCPLSRLRQCLEELLQMGPWDFAIPLSGRDLPLRPVADMAVTLAPYRGGNLLHPGQRKFDRPGEEGQVFAM